MNDETTIAALYGLTTFWTVIAVLSSGFAYLYRKWYIEECGVCEAWRDNYMNLTRAVMERK